MHTLFRELDEAELQRISGGIEDCGNVPIFWDGNPFPMPDPEFRFPTPPPKLFPKG